MERYYSAMYSSAVFVVSELRGLNVRGLLCVGLISALCYTSTSSTCMSTATCNLFSHFCSLPESINSVWENNVKQPREKDCILFSKFCPNLLLLCTNGGPQFPHETPRPTPDMFMCIFTASAHMHSSCYAYSFTTAVAPSLAAAPFYTSVHCKSRNFR